VGGDLGVALADHYYALLVVVPEAIWLVWLHRRNRTVLVAFAGVAIVGFALLPLAISQNHTGNASWIAPIPLRARLGQIVPNFITGFQAPAQLVLLRIGELAVLVALILLALRSEESDRRGALIAGSIALSGFVLNLLLIAVGIDDLISRNVIALWVPAALVVSAGLGARRAGLIGLVATVALCVIGIVAAIGVDVDRSFQRPDWHAVERLLGTEPEPAVGARAILIQDYRDALPLSLYLPHLSFVRAADAPAVRELDVVAISAPRVHLCWWGAACNLTGSRLQASYPLAGLHQVWRRRELQFSVAHMVASRPIVISAARVAPILTTTRIRHDEILLQRRPG
jgi:hypothetical protein